MSKGLREAVKLAEHAGLRLVEIRDNSRHKIIVVENTQGCRMYHPVSKGMSTAHPDFHNMRGQFKRFARGMTHGLRTA